MMDSDSVKFPSKDYKDCRKLHTTNKRVSFRSQMKYFDYDDEDYTRVIKYCAKQFEYHIEYIREMVKMNIGVCANEIEKILIGLERAFIYVGAYKTIEAKELKEAIPEYLATAVANEQAYKRKNLKFFRALLMEIYHKPGVRFADVE